MTYSLRSKYPRANKPAASKDTSNAVKKQRVKRGGAKAIHEDDNKDSFQKFGPSEICIKKPAVEKTSVANRTSNIDISNVSLYYLASRQLDRGSTNIFTNGDSKSSSSLAELQDDGLAGRDEEKNRLQEFWEKHVLGKHPGSLYISGQPGTGKTALLKEFMAKYHPKRGNAGKGAIHVVHFNCVAVTGPKAFLPALLEAIPTKSNASSEPLERLKHLVTTAPGFFVLILDELDHLLSSAGGGAGQEILYQIFELVHFPASKLSVIGVANDLNLTDRFLPRLRVRGFEPTRIRFQPYSLEQITTILTRLISPVEREAIRRSEASGETPKPLFQAAALEFCARKVASVSGDLRRALDLMRQAVNIAESEAPSNTLVQVSVGHILKAEQASAGSPAFKAIQALPLNAQVLLVSILHLLSKSTSLTITQLYEEYSRICKNSGLYEALSISEVGALLDNLETNGLIVKNSEAKGVKGTPVRRTGLASAKSRPPSIFLLIPKADLQRALKANELLRAIIPPEK